MHADPLLTSQKLVLPGAGVWIGDYDYRALCMVSSIPGTRPWLPSCKQNLVHGRYRAIEHAGPARIASNCIQDTVCSPATPTRACVTCAARVAVVQEDTQERAAVLRPERGDHCAFLTARLTMT